MAFPIVHGSARFCGFGRVFPVSQTSAVVVPVARVDWGSLICGTVGVPICGESSRCNNGRHQWGKSIVEFAAGAALEVAIGAGIRESH